MKYDPEKHHRRSIRLKGYNYSRAGAYFVTICTQNRKCLFGDIVNGEMVLNEHGKIVESVWNDLPNHYAHIELDCHIVMPNHFHGIVSLTNDVGAIHESPLQMTVSQRRNMILPKLIGRFKMLTSKRINQTRNTPGAKLWQRNYYEHIVRDENELGRIRQYIMDNPAKWESDRNYQPNFAKVRAIRESPQPYGKEPWMV